MASTQVSAGTGASIGSGVAWTNPGNITVSDDSRASAQLSSGAATSRLLRATNFDFSAIPADATIDGIEDTFEVFKNGTGEVRDDILQHFKDGSAMGDDKSQDTNFTAVDTERVYGGPADLWGLSYDVSDIQDSANGVQLTTVWVSGAATFSSVDHVQRTVHWHQTAPLVMNSYRHRRV